MSYPAVAAAPTTPAAKRQPIFLPGFDRATQLGMAFSTNKFATSWLRRTFTNEYDPSVQALLAADEYERRERRATEVRYGNNITLLLKARYLLRDFHGCRSLWAGFARFLAVNPHVAETTANLFVEARARYLSSHTPRETDPLTTEATHWVDQWASFLDKPTHPERALASDNEVFAAVNDFFGREKARNGDLASILSGGPATDAPSAPRAFRNLKRSPSPNASQFTPNVKRRTISKSTDEPVYDSPPPGTTRSQYLASRFQPSSHPKQDPQEMTVGTNSRQYQNDQFRRTSQEEPYFELKIRGQAERDNRNSPSHQDYQWCEPDEYEALARSNIELRDRVASLEKERLEATTAQKDRDDAIRALQVRFTTFEKTSAAADARASINSKLIQEVQELVRRLETQSARLQKMEKQLEVSDQAAQRMQATISSLQKNIETQPRPANECVGVATTEIKTEHDGAPETLKKEVSEISVRIMSLEAKSVLFNDLHNAVRKLKTEIGAQKDKADTLAPDAALEKSKQETSARLRAVEEGMERQSQSVQETTDRMVALEDQATLQNAKIASLESRLDTAEDIPRLQSRVSTVEQNQINDTKRADDRFAEMLRLTEGMQKRLDDADHLPLIEVLTRRLSEMQTRIANAEDHGSDTSKRLDDIESELSQDASTLHDHSSRIDEASQSLRSTETILLSLARTDDLEALRAELKTLSETQSIDHQAMKQSEDAHASVKNIIQSLSNRITRLGDMYEENLKECRNGYEQQLHTNWETVQNEKQNDIPAVIDSLCQRVAVMERGFQIMRDAMTVRRR